MLPILLLLIPQLLFANTIDSLLADNRIRAGVRADNLFAPLDKPDTSVLSADMLEDYRFLLANLPLGDLARMTAEDIKENVRLARQAKESFSWGDAYPQEYFRSFVLPHRVSQEPFVHWRKQFLEEIGPRVKDLSMADAILEVNHWSHEKATYRPTDGRDQDPLTTIRSGFGRCEEEMILTICALRSVGIPARQCYTPYWAHSDDNHAWVEAWADGKWYYLGACEPAQELNQAWFSGPAQRAMLVVSTAYGDVESPQSPPANTDFPQSPPAIAGGVGGVASEPVLRRFGRSTLINSTAVYGPTKELVVKVFDNKSKPAPDVRVIFSLWNYGTLMPATSVVTDKNGEARLVCGIGDWFVSAQSSSLITHPSSLRDGGVASDPIDDDILFWVTGIPKVLRTKIASWFKDDPKLFMAFAHVKGSATEVTLKLDSTTPANWPTELEYTPPITPVAKAPEVISAEGIARGITSSTTQSLPSIEGGVGGGALSKALADSLFRARLAWEDSVRESGLYRTELEFRTIGELDSTNDQRKGKVTTVTIQLDSGAVWAQPGFVSCTEQEKKEIWSILKKSGKNWFNVYKYLLGFEKIEVRKKMKENYDLEDYPFTMPVEGQSWPPFGYALSRLDFDYWRQDTVSHFSKEQLIMLQTLSDKDLPGAYLKLSFLRLPVIFDNENPALNLQLWEFLDSHRDSLEMERFLKYVLPLRIDYEPLGSENHWIRNSDLSLSNSSDSLISLGLDTLAFLRDSITLESTPDRLGPPLTPAQCLELRRGTESDIERLYIGLCRVRGIPARRNPVTGQVERWEESVQQASPPVSGNWVAVEVLNSPKPKAQSQKPKASLTITIAEGDSLSASALYMKDWAVAKWEGNVADVMDFGWHEPFEKISWPQELPIGWYMISSGKRREDGSASVTLKWVEVKKETTNCEFKIED